MDIVSYLSFSLDTYSQFKSFLCITLVGYWSWSGCYHALLLCAFLWQSVMPFFLLINIDCSNFYSQWSYFYLSLCLWLLFFRWGVPALSLRTSAKQQCTRHKLSLEFLLLHSSRRPLYFGQRQCLPLPIYTLKLDLLMTGDNNYKCHQGIKTVQITDSQMSFLVPLQQGFTREFWVFQTCNYIAREKKKYSYSSYKSLIVDTSYLDFCSTKQW